MKQIKLLLMVAVVAFVGCGRSDLPELGEVHGTVTLDGAPLPNAIVNFTPKEAGRPSSGETDENGNYTLLYLVDVPGALVGEHTVLIEPVITADMDDYDPDDPESGGAPPPVYPASASDGSIVETVSAGDNEINIPLISGESE